MNSAKETIAIITENEVTHTEVTHAEHGPDGLKLPTRG